MKTYSAMRWGYVLLPLMICVVVCAEGANVVQQIVHEHKPAEKNIDIAFITFQFDAEQEIRALSSPNKREFLYVIPGVRAFSPTSLNQLKHIQGKTFGNYQVRIGLHKVGVAVSIIASDDTIGIRSYSSESAEGKPTTVLHLFNNVVRDEITKKAQQMLRMTRARSFETEYAAFHTIIC